MGTDLFFLFTSSIAATDTHSHHAGTFFLVLAVSVVSGQQPGGFPNVFAPFVIGITLMVSVFFGKLV